MLLVCIPEANASGIRCIEGGIVGGAAGSLIGNGWGKVAAEVLGVVAGCDIATRNESQTTTTTRTVTVVPGGGYGNSYHNDYGRRAPCIDYRDCREHSGSYQGASNSGNYFTRDEPYRVVTTTVEKPAVRQATHPTVSNYLQYDWPVTPAGCNMKTGNAGVDGVCLLSHENDLILLQRACMGKTNEIVCPKDLNYNPGEWAGIYHNLGNELIAEQERIQGYKDSNK